MNFFTYNGQSSADFGLHIESKNVFSAPAFDATFQAPFTLGLAYPPLVLKGNVCIPVVDGMTDIGFVFHNTLDLRYRPCVASIRLPPP